MVKRQGPPGQDANPDQVLATGFNYKLGPMGMGPKQTQTMIEKDVAHYHNGAMAGRMPPGLTIGINPLDFAYKLGTLSLELKSQLGEPLPSLGMRSSFSVASTNQAAQPDPNTPLIDLNLKPTPGNGMPT